MPDWPTEIITDQDPRYRELLEQESEARVRFLASEQARVEIATAAAGRQSKTSWKAAASLPVRDPDTRAIPWTRSR